MTLRICAAGLCAVAAFAQPPKRRIAVFDFDSAAAQGGMQMQMLGFETKAPNLGKVAADQLILKLVQSGKVTVIERSAIDKLLAEQNLTNSDRTDAATAAKLGKILGVDGIVLGSITQYDFEDKMTGGGGSRLGGFGGMSMNAKHDYRARVKLTARLVRPDTAEVLEVAEGFGEIVKKNVKVDMRDTGRMQAAMMGGNASVPEMNEAMEKALTALSGELETDFARLPARTNVVDGLVADAADSGRLVLNVGTRNGVKAGDVLEVWRVGKEIRDPATGRVLLRDDTLLGEAVVTKADDGYAIAEYKGAPGVKAGDAVRTRQR